MNRNAYLEEYWARTRALARHIQSAQAFTFGIYPPSRSTFLKVGKLTSLDSIAVEETNIPAIPINNSIGIDPVPIYSLPNSTLFEPQLTCPILANRQVVTELLDQQRFGEASARFADLTNRLTWANTGYI